MGVRPARPFFDTVIFQSALNFSRTLGPSADVSVRHGDYNAPEGAECSRRQLGELFEVMARLAAGEVVEPSLYYSAGQRVIREARPLEVVL